MYKNRNKLPNLNDIIDIFCKFKIIIIHDIILRKVLTLEILPACSRFNAFGTLYTEVVYSTYRQLFDCL